MIQKELYQVTAQCQAHFENPPVVLKESKQAPLLTHTGVVIARNLIKKLRIAEAIDQNVCILERHRPYHESDHVLTGGEALLDIEWMQEDRSFLRLLGAGRVPDPTTAGDFLARFSDTAIVGFQSTLEKIQDRAFSLLDKKRRKRATIDCDSSIHEVYGKKKEGADYSYNNKWGYNALYVTLAETGDLLYEELGSGNTYSSAGVKEKLPGIIERLKGHFHEVRFRGRVCFTIKGS